MASNVDLKQLAVERSPVPLASPKRGRWLARYVLPGLLVVGFLALLGYAARETLSPPKDVTVIPVITAQTTLDLPADTPLFRAAGWVEPRPTPTLITALSEGVVEKLHVVEGQEVKEGQLVARLVSADAQLALDSAEADVHLREGEVKAANATLRAAKARAEHPIHLNVELADAEAALAKAESEQAKLPSDRKSAQARQVAAKRDWEYRQASDAVPEATLSRSKSEFDAANAAVEEVQTREKRLPKEVTALKNKRDALAQKLAGKVDELHQLAQAQAGVQTAEARLRQARVTCDAALLRLKRMDITSPVAGRVLVLVARPGTRLTGLNPGSMSDTSTVLTLYDPASLQVRVDVRLEDVPKVLSGQKTRIESAVVPGKALEGQVLLATSQADIQKNTLSVKVAIIDPSATLKPEMLCQVTFLSPPRSNVPAKPGKEPYRQLIPRQLVEGSRVWVADRLTGRAHLREVQLGQGAGDLVEVVAGLTSADKLIVAGREQLKEGDRVRIVGEDETLGIGKGK
jgi:multidrug efflux pump subunit AcrA (membrane-fusion protein)